MQGICPNRWHLPSNAEWSRLVKDLDTLRSLEHLKATSGWADSLGGPGDDESGFSAIPGGWATYNSDADKYSYEERTQARYWTSTAWTGAADMSWWLGAQITSSPLASDQYLSVRCVQD